MLNGICSCLCVNNEAQTEQTGWLGNRKVLLGGTLVLAGLAIYLMQRGRAVAEAAPASLERADFEVLEKLAEAFREEMLPTRDGWVEVGLIRDPQLIEAIGKLSDEQYMWFTAAVSSKLSLEGTKFADKAIRNIGPECLHWTEQQWKTWSDGVLANPAHPLYAEARAWIDLPWNFEKQQMIEDQWAAFVKDHLGPDAEAFTWWGWVSEEPCNINQVSRLRGIDDMVWNHFQGPTSVWDKVLVDQAEHISDALRDYTQLSLRVSPETKALVEQAFVHISSQRGI